MSDFAAVLYPSHAPVGAPAPAPRAAPVVAPAAPPPAQPAPAATQAPARSGAGVLYQDKAAGQTSTERVLASMAVERPSTVTPEQALYADSPRTNGPVDFQEPVASAAQLGPVLVPPDAAGWDHGAAGQAERAQLAAALSEAGAGAGITREVWGDFVRASVRPVTTTPAAAMAELQQAWGGQTAAKVEAARALVAKVAERFPDLPGYLERTGLGNDPAFVRKVAARAARMPGRGRAA